MALHGYPVPSSIAPQQPSFLLPVRGFAHQRAGEASILVPLLLPANEQEKWGGGLNLLARKLACHLCCPLLPRSRGKASLIASAACQQAGEVGGVSSQLLPAACVRRKNHAFPPLRVVSPIEGVEGGGCCFSSSPISGLSPTPLLAFAKALKPQPVQGQSRNKG